MLGMQTRDVMVVLGMQTIDIVLLGMQTIYYVLLGMQTIDVVVVLGM